MFYIIANFKSNLTKSDFDKYVEILDRGLGAFKIIPDLKIVLCPPTLYVSKFEILKKYDFISLGLQNVSPFSSGPYTGEINTTQLKDYCDYCIIGHSERRKYFNEDIGVIKDKLLRLKEISVKPVVCVSDPNELATIIDQVENTLVAYEPLEYINGKQSAPLDLVDNFYNASSLSQIIYGGSVNLDNFETYLSKKYINGFLVGGFCLNPVDFLKIIQKTNNLLSV